MKPRCDPYDESSGDPTEEKLMATASLAVTLTTPISELRPATTDRILVIEDDRALRKILRKRQLL